MLAAEFDFPPKAPPPATIPQLVSHRDEVAQRLRHLAVVNGFDVRAAELAMIQRLASAYEMPDVAEHACVEKERAARTQEMLSFMCSGNTTTSGEQQPDIRLVVSTELPPPSADRLGLARMAPGRRS